MTDAYNLHTAIAKHIPFSPHSKRKNSPPAIGAPKKMPPNLRIYTAQNRPQNPHKPTKAPLQIEARKKPLTIVGDSATSHSAHKLKCKRTSSPDAKWNTTEEVRDIHLLYLP